MSVEAAVEAVDAVGDGGTVLDPIDMTDGRRTRRVRNKVAVIDAYLDLVGEGNDSPSVAEVAERSRVSHRSVFRYFSDKDDLARSSIDRQIERLGPLLTLTVAADAPLPERVDHLLRRRFELFVAIAPVARLMRTLASKDESMQTSLTANRSSARRQIRWLFGAELARFDDDRAAEVLGVIDVLCSFESGELFRWDLEMSLERSVAALGSAITTLLDQATVDRTAA